MRILLCFFIRSLLLLILTLIAYFDHKKRIIPNLLNAMILLLGILLAILLPEEIRLWERLLGLGIISLPLILINQFYPSGFGGGDIKLLAATGFYLGWMGISQAAFIGSFCAAIHCLGMLLLHRIDKKDKVAFGPYLCFGIIWVMAFG